MTQNRTKHTVDTKSRHFTATVQQDYLEMSLMHDVHNYDWWTGYAMYTEAALIENSHHTSATKIALNKRTNIILYVERLDRLISITR